MKNQLSTTLNQLLITLLFSVIIDTALFAQIPGLTQFTLNDGLPSNTVYDIAQDEKGNLIFATDYGLSKFDGVSFKNFTIEDGIPNNEILQLFKDSKNRIWLIGFNGKISYYFEGKIYNDNEQSFLKELKSNSLNIYTFEDTKNNIWFMDIGLNIVKINSHGKITKYKYNLEKDFNPRTTFLVETNDSVLHLATSKSYDDINKIFIKNFKNLNSSWTEITDLSIFNKNQINKINQFIPSSLKNLDPTISAIFKSVVEKKTGANLLFKTYNFDKSFWVTSLNKGAYLFNQNNLENPVAILPNFQTTRAFQDRENNVWIGTMANGVILFPDYNTTSYVFDNVLDNDLYTVDILNGFIFLGNSFGKVTVLKEKTLELVKSYSTTNSTNIIDRARAGKVFNNELHFLTNDNYVIFTKDLDYKNVISKLDKVEKELNHKSFKSLYTNGKNTLIANATGIFSIDIKTKKRNVIHKGRTTSVYINKDTIWYGSTNGLNYIYNNKVMQPQIPSSFNETIITDINQFDGGIIIGTNSKGIGLYKNGKLKVIDKSSGLLSNSVKSIFVAKNNDLWVATNYGLNRVVVDASFKPVSIQSYTISEGLNTNDVRNCYATEKYVYVATSKGLNIIDLTAERKNYEKPTIHINEIILNNKSINISNTNTNFKSSENNIQFNYSGISFKSLGHISFRYRLVGLEDEWIQTKNNTVRYSALPFGNYTFELMSVTKNNIECSDPLQYSFRIKRPFYHTWIFRISALLVVVGIVYLWFTIRINRLKKQRLLDEKINSLRYTALNAQMNPHFINNLLTMIINLIDNGGKAKALEYLLSFSSLVNHILKSTKLNLISLRNELEIVKLYTQLGSLKLSNNLTLTIQNGELEDEDFDAIKIPPMILQPLVENCLRHAFATDYKNPTITIDFKFEDDVFLVCTITDNGIGFNPSNTEAKTEGISLHNIDERLTLMADSRTENETFINITNLSSEIPNLVGTKVELRIPLIYT